VDIQGSISFLLIFSHEQIHREIFDHGRFTPSVVLTDGAKGFAKALKIMKESGLWPETHHLLCRWHIYDVIKRHCSPHFARYPKGQKLEMLNQFIGAFRNVICAPTEVQMKALWRSQLEAGQFPKEALEYVKREYYDHSRVRQFMECYIFDAGNLQQTTTSRNEGTHRAIRTNVGIISKMSTAYLQRRQRNIQYMQQLRAQAIRGSNTLDLDIQLFPELCELMRKISRFALQEIRKQISLARAEEAKGNSYNPWDYGEQCDCHNFRRYGLPCWHMVPIDGTCIPLEKIAPFWRIDNWDQGDIA